MTKKGDSSVYGEGSSQDRTMNTKNKSEGSAEETCRVCLKDGKLPIFGGGSSEELCESIYEIGAVEVCADDPYPKYLCHACYALLQGAILFRKNAQTSDIFLKSQKKTKPEPFSETDNQDDPSDGDTYEIPINTREERKLKCPKMRMCIICDIEFSTFQEYCDHLLSNEHENKRVTCHVPKNTYPQLKDRKNLSLNKQKTAHICDICGKRFAVKSLFTRHRAIHFYDLPYQCALCPYRGRFAESLKIHMRTHTGERPYQCDQCPSRFISKGNLNKHVITHKGEREFSCEACGRGFYTKKELDLHVKVDHAGIREHVCSTCGKTFGYRKHLMKHELRVHKREKLKGGKMPIYLKVETMKQQNVEVVVET